MQTETKFFCNICFIPDEQSRQKYYITQCGHLFCASCLPKNQICSVCQKSPIQILELTSPLPQQVAHLFVPPVESMNSIISLFTFKQDQTNLLAQRIDIMEKKYNKLKKTIVQRMEEQRKLDALLHALKEEHKMYEAAYGNLYMNQNFLSGSDTTANSSQLSGFLPPKKREQIFHYNAQSRPPANFGLPPILRQVHTMSATSGSSDEAAGFLTPRSRNAGAFKVPEPRDARRTSPRSAGSSDTELSAIFQSQARLPGFNRDKYFRH